MLTACWGEMFSSFSPAGAFVDGVYCWGVSSSPSGTGGVVIYDINKPESTESQTYNGSVGKRAASLQSGWLWDAVNGPVGNA